MIIIQITRLSRSNEKIAAPPARADPGGRRRGCSAPRGGPALSSFSCAPGYFSLALSKQDTIAAKRRPNYNRITDK